MNKRSIWPITFAASLAAFVFGTLACALLHAALVAFTSNSFSVLQALAFALQVYGIALLFGCIPLLVICIPLFGYLRRRNQDSYLTVGAIGLLPGIAVVIFGPWQLGVAFLGYGFGVSLLAQLFAQHADTYQHAA